MEHERKEEQLAFQAEEYVVALKKDAEEEKRAFILAIGEADARPRCVLVCWVCQPFGGRTRGPPFLAGRQACFAAPYHLCAGLARDGGDSVEIPDSFRS